MAAAKVVHQYEQPDGEIRWIAADTKALADEAAKKKGWHQHGTGDPIKHTCGHDHRALKNLGCDVVL